LIIQDQNYPALVDLEEMYGPGFVEPREIPAGSPGYAHISAPKGLWSEEADRFSGAILLTEMLTWHDPAVREAAWGESFFAPRDMQNENDRLDILRNSLENHFGGRILELFDQAWRSDSLRDCPSFAEWAVALPEKYVQKVAATAPISVDEEPTEEPLAYYIKAQKAQKQGDAEAALASYMKAIALAPPELSREIEEQILLLEQSSGLPLAGAISMETGKRGDPEVDIAQPTYCPICEKPRPANQETCPHRGKDLHQEERQWEGGKKNKAENQDRWNIRPVKTGRADFFIVENKPAAAGYKQENRIQSLDERMPGTEQKRNGCQNKKKYQ
jgi:hypothetical protein